MTPLRISGTPGPEIGVVSTPIGRRACVLTAAGTLHRGYVPESGYRRAQNEVLHVGSEVRFRHWNANGQLVQDADGIPQTGATANGWGFVHAEEGCWIEVRYIEAPGTAPAPRRSPA